MTNLQINIAIAEACGYYYMDIVWHLPNGARADKFPDYANDLNAMHEAEKVLLEQCGGDPQCELWIDYLANLLMAAPCCLREHATARQRAEAFLRTLGKWEEVSND